MTGGFDHRRVVAEIEEEARRLRREGPITPGFERELDTIFTRLGPPAAAEDFDAALTAAEELAYVDAHAPVLSEKPGGAAMKKAVRKAVFFYGVHVTAQVTQFATTIARSVRLLGRRVDALERALPSTAPSVVEIVDALDPGPEGLAASSAIVECLDTVTGRVLVGECGAGELLRMLVDADLDAYGVEPRSRLVDQAGLAGLEVREDTVLDHLRLVPSEALGGVVLVGCVDRLPVGARLEVLREAARTLSVGGLLTVVVGGGTAEDSGAAAIADLMGERPLRPATWRRLLELEGVDVVSTVSDGVEGSAPPLVVGRRAVALTAVHQFVPSLASRDAIGAHALQVQRLLHELGYRSDFYVAHSDLSGRADVHPYERFAEAADGEPTWLLYQASTGSPMARYLATRPEPKLVNYHNITPPEFFEPWEPTVTTALAAGLRQMEDLAPSTELAIADSPFNERDLVRLGYTATGVVPILFDPESLDVESDPALVARLQADRRDGGAEWLFVGRLSPNKAQHDVIKAFAAYRVAYDPRARLRIVGGSSSHLYERAIENLAHEIGCGEAVTFSGSVTAAELAAYYRNADVFVCLSRHEGFCVPLLEAMHHGVPIVALRSTAVPDTLGDGGVLVSSAAPAMVAAAAARVLRDVSLTQALVDAGRARLADFAIARSRVALAEAISAVCGSP